MFHFIHRPQIWWIFSNILVSICFGVLDYTSNCKLKLQSLKTELTKAEETVFEYVVRDFEKLLDFNNQKRGKFRFLQNLEVAHKPTQNTKIRIEQGNGLFKIITNDKKILVSLRDIKNSIGALVPKEINFNIETQALKESSDLKKSLVLMPENLYLNYEVTDNHLKNIRNDFIIQAVTKTIMICFVLIALNITFLIFYNSKEYRALSDEIYKLRQGLIMLTTLNNNIHAENELLQLIVGKSTDKIEINSLCEIFRNYFNDKDTKIEFECNFNNKQAYALDLEIAVILLSIIFYRKALSTDILLKVSIWVEKSKLKVLIQDNGFKLLKGKIITYTGGISKPSFILEWDQIFTTLQENDIDYKISSNDDFNFITVTTTLKKQHKKSNVCYLKDFH